MLSMIDEREIEREDNINYFVWGSKFSARDGNFSAGYKEAMGRLVSGEFFLAHWLKG